MLPVIRMHTLPQKFTPMFNCNSPNPLTQVFFVQWFTEVDLWRRQRGTKNILGRGAFTIIFGERGYEDYKHIHIHNILIIIWTYRANWLLLTFFCSLSSTNPVFILPGFLSPPFLILPFSYSSLLYF